MAIHQKELVANYILIDPDMDMCLERDVMRLPEHMRESLLDYLRFGLSPGHFLQAVLSNDLAEACARADDLNRAALYDYIYILYNAAPREAWGTSERVQRWIERGREMRKRYHR